ncbi:hypothetical protein GGX14DRAFT_653257 [Mycena pura]|uniref:Rad60/SUMO-like domain-containing protein n=1 Tax=Mycena pura TaxID=153505 RepID=A0AAD6Y8X3_9AGAR|nr:hypothetical protein GGX14DRAFT_653257 [Mycena pura]
MSLPPAKAFKKPSTPTPACATFPSLIKPEEFVSPAKKEQIQCSPRNGHFRIRMQYDNRTCMATASSGACLPSLPDACAPTDQLFDQKGDTPLKKAMHMFAKKINQEMAFLRFHNQGTRIRETDTPRLLEMDDSDIAGNIIDVCVMQVRL